MRNPRRTTALGVVLGVVFALLTAFGIGAPSASAYGPGACAVISVSSTSPVAGTAITVTGTNFAAKTSLTLVLEAQPDTQGHRTIGVVTTTSAGTFTFSFVVPVNVGLHVITVLGNTDATCPADPFASIDIRAAATTATGGLAFTGVDIAGGVVAALVLLVGGTALTISGRRKRTAHHHTSG